ncbi:MAG: phosphate/phosphite/phosphonate ABC transporter substrate-binding protein [Deltaproteobacteria bacterium]|nr:phosphate/phosphite/phosphonate ABC transporter substrate-binding protein [Deltaproteobacteria bacterium]
MITFHRFIFSTFLMLFLVTPLTGKPPKTEIAMGFNPAENAEAVETNGKVFSDYYQSKMGIKVKTFIATDYTALIEALRSGRVDFAFLPPFSFVKAEEIAGAKVLLKCVRKGKAVLYSAIITRRDKNYLKLEDLKGKNIAWVDPSSTSGHIFAKASLKQKKGIDADKFFGKQIFAGAHDALVLAVLNGTVDAGATFSNDAEGIDGSWTQFLKGDDVKKIRVIYVSEPFTGDTMATSKKFAAEYPEIVDKTVKLMLEMGKDPKGKQILKDLYHVDSLIPAKTEEFNSVRDAAKFLNLGS